MNFDRSVEMFQAGIRAARAGDFVTGEMKIAAAYLLDRRCMRAFVPLLPPEDPMAADCLLDFKLLKKLWRPDGNKAAMAILAIVMGIYSGKYAENQTWLALSLKSSKELLDSLEADPSLERNSSVLEGYLTRPLLHFRRSDVYFALKNQKLATKEMTAALKLDPTLTLIRAERAETRSRMAVNDLGQDAERNLKEWKTVVKESHPDSRELRIAYAWISMLILENPQLGTCEEALEFFAKMEESSKRQVELYGQIGEIMGDFEATLKMAREKFALSEFELSQRRFLDTLPQRLFNQTSPPSRKVKYFCMNCSKGENEEGVVLSKCGGCKEISYCSIECQRADWKNHKQLCKLQRS